MQIKETFKALNKIRKFEKPVVKNEKTFIIFYEINIKPRYNDYKVLTSRLIRDKRLGMATCSMEINTDYFWVYEHKNPIAAINGCIAQLPAKFKVELGLIKVKENGKGKTISGSKSNCKNASILT